jgi:hypothetical protein
MQHTSGAVQSAPQGIVPVPGVPPSMSKLAPPLLLALLPLPLEPDDPPNVVEPLDDPLEPPDPPDEEDPAGLPGAPPSEEPLFAEAPSHAAMNIASAATTERRRTPPATGARILIGISFERRCHPPGLVQQPFSNR